MTSLQYLLATTPGLRRLMQAANSFRIEAYRKREHERCKLHPALLMNFEDRVYSQNGEDGIIAELFRRLGTTDKVFVEFGCGDGTQNNSRRLLEREGWSGFWLDASQEDTDRAARTFRRLPVSVHCRLLTRENIRGVLMALGVPVTFDLLVVDVDGNDYWLWEALADYKPRVVVIEYNAALGPGREWVMPYNAGHVFDGTRHVGASLSSLEGLGRRLGYTLVGCESVGVNAFFVREESVVEELFAAPTGGARFHYVAPKHKACFFGHPSGSGPWLRSGAGWAARPFEDERERRNSYLRRARSEKGVTRRLS